ncbi:MAG: HNH endonuclease, partial [Actinobacteria bacterium]|nr:HNH endonuclease [Actinomycetota bacterium]
MVSDYWHEIGRSGFRIWRYRLSKLADQPNQSNEGHSTSEAPDAPSEAPRRSTTVFRIVRGTRQARWIKELYDYRCQMCETRLE